MTLEQVIADCEEEISDCQIDLDGIMKLVEKYPERKTALAHDIDSLKKHKDYKRQLAAWLKELQERRKQSEQRWIPVSERLPEEHESMFARFYGSERWSRSMWLRQSDRVIVTSELADGTRITETATTWDGEWKPDHTILKREIVAWMPMPKPYKGETDETY